MHMGRATGGAGRPVHQLLPTLPLGDAEQPVEPHGKPLALTAQPGHHRPGGDSPRVTLLMGG